MLDASRTRTNPIGWRRQLGVFPVASFRPGKVLLQVLRQNVGILLPEIAIKAQQKLNKIKLKDTISRSLVVFIVRPFEH